MWDLAEYLVYSLLYPKRRDFISMSLGIRARYGRCKSYWDDHLACSKEFIFHALSQFQPRSLLILGSGRLLDCPREKINLLGAKVTCMDIDPVSVRYAGRLEPTWEFFCDDVTGVVDLWTSKLKEYLISGARCSGDIGRFLSEIELPSKSLLESDVVVSLNLLGQVPIYWRDRVETLIGRYSPVSFSLEDESNLEIHKGLDESCKNLQKGHLNQLFSSARKGVVIISDRSFNYYVEEENSYIDSKSALYLEIPEEGGNLKLESCRDWKWHIAPKGIEEKDFGIIHEMMARSYSLFGK